MEYFSPWPVAVILGVLLVIAATPLMKAADAAPIETRGRVEALDGLRGFLALSVFFSHTAIYHQYLITGRWALTSHAFFTLLGQGGVAVFFMITGYLFWSQLIAKDGRPNWVNLYLGRAFRILPLYWFAVGLVLVEVVFHTGPHLNVGLGALVLQLTKWAAGGLAGQVPVNGYQDTRVLIAGVTWTLAYEWKFYAALLPLSLLARAPLTRILAPSLVLVCVLASLALRAEVDATAGDAVCAALFLAGMTVAALAKASRPSVLAGPIGSAIILALLLAVFFAFTSANAAAPIILLGAGFFLVTSGASLFGLLTSHPARRLGNISFGVYLLQGPVLAGSILVPGARAWMLSSPLAHWTVMGLDAVVLVALSTAAHAFIERPFIALGKRAGAQLALTRAGKWLTPKTITPNKPAN